MIGTKKKDQKRNMWKKRKNEEDKRRNIRKTVKNRMAGEKELMRGEGKERWLISLCQQCVTLSAVSNGCYLVYQRSDQQGFTVSFLPVVSLYMQLKWCGYIVGVVIELLQPH